MNAEKEPSWIVHPDPIRRAEVERQIAVAFADVPYPGDDKVPRIDEYSDPDSDVDFRGRPWRDLSPTEMWRTPLSELGTEALHHYLPAYLIAALHDADRALTPFVMDYLCPGSDLPEDIFQYRQERFAVFSPAERAAIRVVIEYMRDTTGDKLDPGGVMPARAFATYWKD